MSDITQIILFLLHFGIGFICGMITAELRHAFKNKK